jgi:hypothetical protein
MNCRECIEIPRISCGSAVAHISDVGQESTLQFVLDAKPPALFVGAFCDWLNGWRF